MLITTNSYLGCNQNSSKFKQQSSRNSLIKYIFFFFLITGVTDLGRTLVIVSRNSGKHCTETLLFWKALFVTNPSLLSFLCSHVKNKILSKFLLNLCLFSTELLQFSYLLAQLGSVVQHSFVS